MYNNLKPHHIFKDLKEVKRYHLGKKMRRIVIMSQDFVYVSFNSRRRQWHPTPVLLPGESHGQRSLVGYSPWGRKESDMIELMSTHVRSQNSLKLNCEAGPKMTHPTASTGHRHCHLNHAGHQTLMSEQLVPLLRYEHCFYYSQMDPVQSFLSQASQQNLEPARRLGKHLSSAFPSSEVGGELSFVNLRVPQT